MSDRKAELERKKAKLAAMREEKKKKEQGLNKAKTKESEVVSQEPVKKTTDSDIASILEGVGISAAASATPVAPQQSASSQESPQNGALAPGAITVTPTPSPQTARKQLSVSKVTQTNIPPKETVAYSKETQTTQATVDRDEDDMESLDVDTTPTSTKPGKMPQVSPVKPADMAHNEAVVKEEKIEVREISEEEKQQIMFTDDFQKFMMRSSAIMERALAEEDTDIFTDYSGLNADDSEGDISASDKLKLNRTFFDERWSKHRTVTCMDWSVQHPELLVASYNNNEESPHEPDGVALVWNLKFKKTTPEYVFHCQSAVMSTCFAKFHPNLVVGGTYSGQIVLWDNRSNKRTPVQRTPLSAAAHTHPVYCVNVVGTQNAHNLITVSTDGKMCSWSLDMLSQPQDSMELQHKQSKAVAVTSFSFLSGDVNNFVVGSEEGAVYTAVRHGSKAGISEMFEGHQGPVTGIDCNVVPGVVDFSQYFITSSIDWTVKLWNIKENKPLYSFEDNSDYVYDTCWSPIHPALFASVDGVGRLDLWNLNHDTEVPTATTYIENNVALNRCRWHQSGHQIAAGDDIGKIHVYDVGEHIAQPKNDEWKRFVHTLQEIRNNKADAEEEQNIYSGLSAPIR
ncbi:unnamed protein product [Owenia fusiformis]|uniref:Uncharacterized protein n=1 Tax=Owenia fusiformis TaxID=6347 RepID=A0A8J1TRC8_OWEFU|nr:unnamed protein product [Owenia fusiformis]